MTEENTLEPARLRILQTAVEMFVEHGYKATSVRKICEAAQVNVAMVNYYFKSKEELHLAAFDYARELAHVADSDAAMSLPPAEQLRLAIEELVCTMLRSGPSSLFARLVARELIEPTAALHRLAERHVLPQHAQFTRLIRGVVGPSWSAAVVQKCVFSVLGQVVFYARSRTVHDLVAPEITYDEAGITAIAAHISRFTLAALAGMCAGESAAEPAGESA